MSTLVCLGFGYCARHYAAEFGARFDRIVGTTRSADRIAALGRRRFGGRSVEMLVFDARSRELAAAVAQADALLISAAPAEARDPVLAAFGDEIARAPRLRSLVYLSTLGVYGDSGGAWIDETAPTIAARARRGHARIDDGMPSSPAGHNALRVEHSLAAEVSPTRYAATLPGSAGFELSSWIRIGADTQECSILTLRGSDVQRIDIIELQQ